jgi:C4-dicarboxylate-specific signal transduction histidine kinase
LNHPSIRSVLLFALTFLASFLILGSGLNQAFQWQKFTIASDDSKLESKLNSLYVEVYKILEIRMGALELMADQIRNDLEHRPFVPSDYYPLLTLYVEKFNMTAAGIMDSNGIGLENSSSDPKTRKSYIGRSFRDRGHVDLAPKLRSSVIMHAQRGKFSDSKVIIMAAPIWDKTKTKIVAYVGASIVSQEINALVKKIVKNSPELRIVILDQRNVVITSNEPSIKGDAFTPVKTDLYNSREKTAIREGVDEKGIESRTASRGLAFRNATWTLAISESTDYLKRQEILVWKQTALIIGIAVALSFLASFIISNLITKPILNLVNGMKFIEEGRFHESKVALKEHSIFKETVAAWDALASMEKKLRANTENLENLVQERTTELIETHRDLDEQRARAMEASRLAALGEMAGGIAHEINNPLGVILVSAESQLNKIKRGHVNLADIENSLKKIEDTAVRIAKIVQGLKTFSRTRGTDTLQKVTFKSILDSTLALCHEKFIANQVDLRVGWFPEDLTIECGSIQISQVILNLLNNAYDAIENLPEKWIAIEVLDLKDAIEIRVTDSGKGIPETIQEKMFQPFFTTKDIGKGTGLGLSISKGIIESHEGRIFLERKAVHTTFVIHLPKVWA